MLDEDGISSQDCIAIGEREGGDTHRISVGGRSMYRDSSIRYYPELECSCFRSHKHLGVYETTAQPALKILGTMDREMGTNLMRVFSRGECNALIESSYRMQSL